jgi:hypothetical protein
MDGLKQQTRGMRDSRYADESFVPAADAHEDSGGFAVVSVILYSKKRSISK